ncbi:MAG: DUF1080 domain-containing protein [Bacteroidales bacterium]|nr:DUF1080 domain-containing protein [Bacteroidales bacterium]
MKHLLYLLAAVLIFGTVSCTSTPKEEKKADATEEVAVADNTLTEKEKAEGWMLLFDGETTNGWRAYNQEAFPDTGWFVEDGKLQCIHSGLGEAGLGGDVIYDKQFTDFHFKVDWMIDSGGNSGIFYLAQEIPDKQIWYTGPEMQILDNESDHVDNMLGKDGNRRAGSLYDLIAPDPQNAKGAMQWNSVEIMSYQGTIVYKMNGETVIEYHLWTPEWKEMIENSKYPDFNPDFANVAKTGYIGLQDHGNAVWFRNIKIKEL